MSGGSLIQAMLTNEDGLCEYFSIKLGDLQRQDKYLSRWRYELTLDDISHKLAEFLENKLHLETEGGARLGTAVLYRGTEDRFLVGGSSFDRRAMKRTARIYALKYDGRCDPGRPVPRNSYTGFGCLANTSFVLDDFQTACKTFSQRICHEPKEVESGAGTTQSYVLLVLSTDDQLKSIAGHGTGSPFSPTLPDIQHTAPVPSCIHGALRVSSPVMGIATGIFDLLKTLPIDTLTQIMKIGNLIDEKSAALSPISLGDFYDDLLGLKNEYEALDRLTFHLQTLFPSSECSVFVANKWSNPESRLNCIELTLAATTAWSNDDDQNNFRDTFFRELNSYSCEQDPQGAFLETTNGVRTDNRIKF
jgi:hypothetical protein